MDRTGVAAHPARRVRQDRHGAGAGARDEQLFLLDQPLRRSAARGCDRRHPDAAHHSAKRHRFGHRAGCIPLRPLPRRTQQVALHPDSAHRCALHRFVPADAHDAAGAADPDLRGVGGDDERPMAFAHRLPRLAGALGHRPLVVHGTHRPRHDGHLPQPADRDARFAADRGGLRLPHAADEHPAHGGTLRRFDGLRPGDRLYLRIGAQTAPAGAHPELPGHRRQTAGDRLQRQPVENRHRLGRPLRQGA